MGLNRHVAGDPRAFDACVVKRTCVVVANSPRLAGMSVTCTIRSSPAPSVGIDQVTWSWLSAGIGSERIRRTVAGKYASTASLFAATLPAFLITKSQEHSWPTLRADFFTH
jgi:hypothetical protein